MSRFWAKLFPGRFLVVSEMKNNPTENNRKKSGYNESDQKHVLSIHEFHPPLFRTVAAKKITKKATSPNVYSSEGVKCPVKSSGDFVIKSLSRAKTRPSNLGGWTFKRIMPGVLDGGYRDGSEKSVSRVMSILDSFKASWMTSPFFIPVGTRLASCPFRINQSMRRTSTFSSIRNCTSGGAGKFNLFAVYDFRGQVEGRTISNMIETMAKRHLKECVYVSDKEMKEIMGDKDLLKRIKKGSEAARKKIGRFVD